MLLDSEPEPGSYRFSGLLLTASRRKMLEWVCGGVKQFEYAFEFVAGKYLPAFFGAQSRVAEALQLRSSDVGCHHTPDKAG